MAAVPAEGLSIARFSVEQYHRMVASGAFSEDDRLELLDGWVVTQMAKGPGHEYAVGRGDELIRTYVPVGWHVRNQAPITLARSEPEPDLVIARGDRGRYRSAHPRAEDVALVVEVADSSIEADRVKGTLYGAAGVPIYWIVNLGARRVEAYSRPDAARPSGYAGLDVYGEDDAVPVVIDGAVRGHLQVADLLP